MNIAVQVFKPFGLTRNTSITSKPTREPQTVAPSFFSSNIVLRSEVFRRGVACPPTSIPPCPTSVATSTHRRERTTPPAPPKNRTRRLPMGPPRSQRRCPTRLLYAHIYPGAYATSVLLRATSVHMRYYGATHTISPRDKYIYYVSLFL